MNFKIEYMKNLRKKLSYTLYFMLAVVCPMCWKQLGIRFIQPIGKKGKGTWRKVKIENDDVVVIEDLSEYLSK
jgi:hypothetical protein